jgi:hypothetical protein
LPVNLLRLGEILKLFFGMLAASIVLATTAQAGTLKWCPTELTCTTISEGQNPKQALEVLSGHDCTASCKRECREEYNDCIRNGSSKSECAALRSVCEQDCKNN